MLGITMIVGFVHCRSGQLAEIGFSFAREFGLTKIKWHVFVLHHVLNLPTHGEKEENTEIHE